MFPYFVADKIFELCIFEIQKKGVDQTDLKKELYIGFDRDVAIKDIFRIYKFNDFLLNNFPTIFKRKMVVVEGNFSGLKELQLKLKGIYFEKSSEQFMLKSISFRPIVLILFLINEFENLFDYKSLESACSIEEVIFQVRNVFQSSLYSKNGDLLHQSKTLEILRTSIRNDFAYGEMLDYIDHSYDLYKQLIISPSNYYLLFCSFGYAIDDIGNRAYEVYNANRDKEKCWRIAVENYMYENLHFNKELSSEFLSCLF